MASRQHNFLNRVPYLRPIPSFERRWSLSGSHAPSDPTMNASSIVSNPLSSSRFFNCLRVLVQLTLPGRAQVIRMFARTSNVDQVSNVEQFPICQNNSVNKGLNNNNYSDHKLCCVIIIVNIEVTVIQFLIFLTYNVQKVRTANKNIIAWQ